MNNKGNNNECDICAGRSVCYVCGNKNEVYIMKPELLMNRFKDIALKNKIALIRKPKKSGKIEVEMMSDDIKQAYLDGISHKTHSARESIKDGFPFSFEDGSYTKMLGNIKEIMTLQKEFCEMYMTEIVAFEVNRAK